MGIKIKTCFHSKHSIYYLKKNNKFGKHTMDNNKLYIEIKIITLNYQNS